MFPTSQSGTGAAVRGNRKAEEWTTKCLQLVHSSHRVLSSMCEQLDTDEEPAPREPPGLRIIQIPEGESLGQMAALFLQQCHSLTKQLSTPVEGAVRLPLGVILRLVTRCLGISYKDVTSLPSLKELASSFLCLQQAALDILSYLILCCGTNLLPYSRLILDRLQQVLLTSKLMETSQKSTTRCCVYRVVSEWVKMAGMGRHFHSQLNVFVQELISDMGPVDKPQQTNGTGVTEPITADVPSVKGTGKGKKKKKNRVADSYKDLPATNNSGDGTADPDLCKPHVAEVTLAALELSNVILERGQFIQFQKLIRHILETTSTLQRSEIASYSPFSLPTCRVKLYQAVWCCAQIPLDIGASTSDTVAHFQQSNQALSLIARASHTDCLTEVHSLCTELLFRLRSFGSLQKPIVRKVLPDDKRESHDASEALREVEKLSEENESLRQRLLEVEMDQHSQSRLVLSLKQEIEELKAAQTLKESGPKKSDNDSSEEVVEESIHEEESTELPDDSISGMNASRDGDEEEVEVKAQEVGKRKGKKRKKKTRGGQKSTESADISGTSDQPKSSDDTVHPPTVKKQIISAEKGVKKADKKQKQGTSSQEELRNVDKTQTQPMSSAGDVETVGKQSQTDENENESAEVEEMLMDFIDADPDV